MARGSTTLSISPECPSFVSFLWQDKKDTLRSNRTANTCPMWRFSSLPCPARCRSSMRHIHFFKITASCFGTFIDHNCTTEWSRPFPSLVQRIIEGLYILWKTASNQECGFALSVWLVPRQPAPPKGEPWNAPGNHCYSESLHYSQRESLGAVRTQLAGT